MPTTRSKGRSEPLQSLETPPKRSRKTKKLRLAPPLPQDLVIRTLSVSPEPIPVYQLKIEAGPSPIHKSSIRPTYVDACTQTASVIILTKAEAAELNDKANAASTQKRNRDDESEDEPTAKRHQFSTPQNDKMNNLWMFGDRANGEHPRTAPSKPFVGSYRRPARSALQKRNNTAETPRFRSKATTQHQNTTGFDRIKPIEQENTSAKAQNDEQQEAQPAQSSPHTEIPPQDAPQTPKRGLFGSLRGMVNKGWDLATSLTPRGAMTEPRSNDQSNHQASPESEGDQYPRMNPSSHERARSRSAERNKRYAADDQPSSAYDHLHYISANSESVDKAISGQIAPPQDPPTPPSPASRARAQNPELSDATIDSIMRKRERKAVLDEKRYGPRSTPQSAKVAPLFGPDSHFARGTVDPRFLPPTPLYGPSKKRKLDIFNDQTPAERNKGFALDNEDLDMDGGVNDNVVQEADDEVDVDRPPNKKHRTDETSSPDKLATPRSAMRKPGIRPSTGRKSVAFGSSMFRDIRGHYGPAGQYKGSTFADELPDDSRSLSSIDPEDVISPATRLNTFANSGKKPASVLDNLGARIPAIDFTLRDPNDKNWRPSLGNPRPGVFRVPDIDEEDPDESMAEDDTPEQPQTPRMSHAELPATPTTAESALVEPSFNESSIMHESTELALDKARLKAEKYKPKSSSRLSEVSRARSRSTSPDEEEQDSAVTPIATGTQKTGAPAVRPIGAPPQPFVPRELDNIAKGSDGMTDFQREHQYDEWAANLTWDKPQTYEDAGTGTAFIHNLIRKNWTEEDSWRSEIFWSREFDEVEAACKNAKAKGLRLELVTGMEEIKGY